MRLYPDTRRLLVTISSLMLTSFTASAAAPDDAYIPEVTEAVMPEDPTLGVPTEASHTDCRSCAPNKLGPMFTFKGNMYFISYRVGSSPGSSQQKILETSECRLRKASLTSSGAVKDLGEVATFILPTYAKSNSLSAVVYNDKVYLFFMHYPINAERNIRYAVSSDPEKSWDTNGGSGYTTDFKLDKNSSYYPWRDGLRAAVVGNSLFLVFYYKDGVYYARYNDKSGAKTRFPVEKAETSFSDTQGSPFFFATPYYMGDKQTPMMCVGIRDNHDSLSIWRVDESGNYTYYFSLNAVDIASNMMAATVATIKNGQQYKEVLHIFAYQPIENKYPIYKKINGLMHMEISLYTGSSIYWQNLGVNCSWTLLSLYTQEEDEYSMLSATTTSVAVGDNNIRQYVMLLSYSYWSSFVDYAALTSYESDLFKVKETRTLDTNEKEQRGCWSVLGVVEGCPPFSLNGDTSRTGTSEVAFMKEQSKKIQCEVKYEGAVSVGVKKNDAYAIGGAIDDALSKNSPRVYSKTKELSMELGNGVGNEDGAYGWLIVSKPVIQNTVYQWCSQDASTELGIINNLRVGDMLLTYEPYTLESPCAGMASRNKSADLAYWQNVQKKDYKNITRNEFDVLKTSLGGSSTRTLQLSKSEVSNQSVKTTVTISEGSDLRELLDADDIYDSLSMTLSASFKTNYLDLVEASLGLPSPTGDASTYYKSISVKPFWYIPDNDAKLSSLIEKPFWTSTEFSQDDSIPWCISWKVSDLVAGVFNPTAQCDDLDGDSKSDLTLFSSSNSIMNIVSMNGKKVVNVQTDLSSMGLTPLCVATCDAYNRAGVWLYSSLINSMVVGFYSAEDGLSFIPIENSTLSETQTLLDVANYDADSLPELLIVDSATGKLSLWQLTCGETAISITEVSTLDIAWDLSWVLAHNVDMNGDGVNDILFNDKTSGVLRSYIMQDSQVARNDVITIESGCSFLASGDFNGDRTSDLLFSDAKGGLKVSLVTNCVPASSQYISSAPKLRGLEFFACGDYDGDGHSDIVLRKTGGTESAVRLVYCFVKPSEKTTGTVEVHKKTNVTLKDVNSANLQGAN